MQRQGNLLPWQKGSLGPSTLAWSLSDLVSHGRNILHPRPRDSIESMDVQRRQLILDDGRREMGELKSIESEEFGQRRVPLRQAQDRRSQCPGRVTLGQSNDRHGFRRK